MAYTAQGARSRWNAQEAWHLAIARPDSPDFPSTALYSVPMPLPGCEGRVNWLAAP